MATPAIAPPPRPVPLFSDAAVGALSSGDCEVDAPSLLPVLEPSGAIVVLKSVSEPIGEGRDAMSDGKPPIADVISEMIESALLGLAD